jgi:hypothetical protein
MCTEASTFKFSVDWPMTILLEPLSFFQPRRPSLPGLLFSNPKFTGFSQHQPVFNGIRCLIDETDRQLRESQSK